ncbi:hypothetical protein A2U01_0093185, partial [Trifolium medium]|nr:hypothetical protein [Trifolium medium]
VLLTALSSTRRSSHRTDVPSSTRCFSHRAAAPSSTRPLLVVPLHL